MPVILIRCACGREFAVRENLVGTWLQCPDCGRMTFITWPERRAETPRPADELPDEGPLSETPPSSQALRRIALDEDEDQGPPPATLSLPRCVRCGGELREGWLATGLARLNLSNRGSGGAAARRRTRHRSPFCPRCRRAIRTRRQPAAEPNRRVKRPSATAIRAPLAAKLATVNVLSGAVAIHTAQLAAKSEQPLLAAVALFAAAVPLVTLLALVIYLVGRWTRVKDIGFGPAAHAAFWALGIQLLLAIPAYFAAVTVWNASGWGMAQPVVMVAGAVIWLAGAAAIGRALHARMVPAFALATAVGVVLVVAGLALQPLGRVIVRGLPHYLVPSTRPTAATATSQSKPAHPATQDAPSSPTDGGGGGT